MSETKRRRGPIPGTATVKCTVMLEPDLHEWGIEQTGGLSETVRRALREWRMKGDAKFRLRTNVDVETLAERLAQLPDKHRGILGELVGMLSKWGDEPYRLEPHVYSRESGGNTIVFHLDDKASEADQIEKVETTERTSAPTLRPEAEA